MLQAEEVKDGLISDFWGVYCQDRNSNFQNTLVKWILPNGAFKGTVSEIWTSNGEVLHPNKPNIRRDDGGLSRQKEISMWNPSRTQISKEYWQNDYPAFLTHFSWHVFITQQIQTHCWILFVSSRLLKKHCSALCVPYAFFCFSFFFILKKCYFHFVKHSKNFWRLSLIPPKSVSSVLIEQRLHAAGSCSV